MCKDSTVRFIIVNMCNIFLIFCYLYTNCFTVADYRVKQLSGDDKNTVEPLKVNKTSFSEIFQSVFYKSVNNVHKSQFRRLSFSVHGKGIVQICEILLENSSLKAQLSSILEPAFLAVLNSNAADGCSVKETLFSKFYEMSVQFSNEIIIILKDKIDTVLPLRQFACVLLRQVMEDIIDEMSSVYNKDIVPFEDFLRFKVNRVFLYTAQLLQREFFSTRKLQFTERTVCFVWVSRYPFNICPVAVSWTFLIGIKFCSSGSSFPVHILNFSTASRTLSIAPTLGQYRGIISQIM